MNTTRTPGPWKPDLHPSGNYWLVTRWYRQGGHDTLKGPRGSVSKFRKADAAERAATLAELLDGYVRAMKLQPEGAEGHACWYTKELVRQLGMTEKAAHAAIAKAEGGAA